MIPKSKRKKPAAHLRAYDKMVRIRKVATISILKDFGIRGNLTDEEIMLLNEERSFIFELMRKSASSIDLANSIYITSYEEYIERRELQEKALGYVISLLHELQYVIDVYKEIEKLGHNRLVINVNKYDTISQMIDEELGILKAWRRKGNLVGEKYLKDYQNRMKMKDDDERMKNEIVNSLSLGLSEDEDRRKEIRRMFSEILEMKGSEKHED